MKICFLSISLYICSTNNNFNQMKNLYLALLGVVFSVYATAQSNLNTYSADVANDYVEFLLELVPETPGFTPPVASRSFGYIGMALYESVEHGSPIYGSLKNNVNQFESGPTPDENIEYHWPTVANNALCAIIDSLYYNCTAENQAALYAIRDAYNAQFESVPFFSESRDYGVAVANAVFAHSITDGGHQCQENNFPASYVIPEGDGLWKPEIVNGNPQKALQPYWGNNRPFVSDNAEDAIMPSQFIPEFGTGEADAWHLAMNEVYETSLNLTAEQTNIAQWWADGAGTITPPGHSMSLARQLLIAEGANLEKAAVVYGFLGMALSDAFLACWKTKYVYNTERPGTYIRQYINSEWLPLLNPTPPFPEFPSGHSSQSGAMGTVLTQLLGGDVAFTDNTWTGVWGNPRQFNSIWEAANEAAVSRLYGGIHPAYGNEGGLYLGSSVGNNILDLLDSVTLSAGVAEAETNDMTVYPNPAQDVVFITHTGKNNLVRIFNTTGQLVGQFNNASQLNVSNYEAGVYIVQVQNNDEQTVRTAQLVVR